MRHRPYLPADAEHASMRPTPEGVGNKSLALKDWARFVASMRPTPEGVGNVSPFCNVWGTGIGLQ